MDDHRKSSYRRNSLTLTGAVAMGTGVMIGAGIFALTGQIAELAQAVFPFAFVAAAVVVAFSAYSYVKLSNAYPSAGGIAMYLQKAYGAGAATAVGALLMYFSMVINESLVARTFGAYTLQVLPLGNPDLWIPVLGTGLLLFAFLVNLASNRFIQSFSFVMAFIKVVGIAALAIGGLWASGFSFESISAMPERAGPMSLLGATALAVLAYKGFTTITNSGSEIVDPHRNVGRAIVISIAVCLVLYILIALAVAGNLTIEQIVQARDYSLAEAAKPAFGKYGLWITVVFAIAATVSGLIASAFAVSRMLAMLTNMELVPHSHFGMPGTIQKHTLVYTIVAAILLTVFFDLSRIAALGAIFYLVMDIAIHWGVLRHLRKEIQANAAVLVTAIVLDVAVLGGLIAVKMQTDRLVLYAAAVGFCAIVAAELLYLRKVRDRDRSAG